MSNFKIKTTNTVIYTFSRYTRKDNNTLNKTTNQKVRGSNPLERAIYKRVIIVEISTVVTLFLFG